MSAHSEESQVSVTPAVKDLRSLFEQKAKQATPANPNPSLRPPDTTLSSASRPSLSRRSSPTSLLDRPSDPLTSQRDPSPSGPRKRPPPPPPPSRGPKQQISSPSPSTSPRLRATLEPNNPPESKSPTPSAKQRLAARLPPPVPDLRLDRTSNVERNSNGRNDVDATLNNVRSTSPVPPPRPPRPVQPPAIQTTPFDDPFESDSREDDLPAPTPRPNQKPPLPRRPARSSLPDPDEEPEFDAEAVPTNALGLDVRPSRRKPALYATPRDSLSSVGRSSASSSSSMSRVPSESDGSGLPPAIPPRSVASKFTDEPLSMSPVSPFTGTPAPQLPSRRPPLDISTSSSPPHITRNASGPTPPPVHHFHSPPPSRIPSARHTPQVHHSRGISASASYPRATSRKQGTFDSDDIDASSPTTEADNTNGDTVTGSRKYGSAICKLPPPPTRMIALGDRLPAVRPTLSDDESEEFTEEEDAKVKLANAMPDTSHSSRRRPVLKCHKYDTVQVMTQTHSAIICAAGHIYVTATGHHVKVFDLSLSESSILSLDHKDFGAKEFKATSLEFCPVNAVLDRGRYVWIGTKEGNMYELDVTTGQLMGSRLSIHVNSIMRIIRHGDKMISVDDGGKVTIWVPGTAGEDLHVASAQIRHSRISDRQAFVEILAGKLWTSARESTAAGARGPAIRIYDVLNPGSATRSVLPTEHVGTVTSGTILPSHPNHVYLGHEGGFVTIWSTATDDGIPVCEEVMRISNSDVLCLVGINDRLWVGGRKGTIAAYSVESRPWVMTNNWVAHWNNQSVLPLQKIAVDLYSIDKIGRLCVYSVGRDDHVKTWDGLLGADWQDTELSKLENSFSHFRNISILFVSWNIGATKPEHLSGSKENSSFLYDALKSVDSPDIIVFGLQEVVPLDKANVAKFIKKKKGLEGASTTLHAEHRRWADKLVGAVAFALPDERYKLLYSKELVGLLSCVMIKTKELGATRDCAAHTISRGVGNRFGNKGAVAVRLLIDDTSLCFLNCHLAAGHRRVRDRNADAAAIIEHERLFPELETLDETALVGGGDGTMALDHEIVFMSGDLNYRIDQRRDAVVSSVHQNAYHNLLMHDQLSKEMKTNIRLRSFMEGPITFPPTYKYDLHSAEYDSSEKRRIPAWCDRVLWRARDVSRVEQLHYQRYEPDISDHRPISAAFRVLVKSVQHDAREKIKMDVEAQWSAREMQLLVNARAFYTEQLVL